jgi:serine/threonine-protein kinase HipA
MVTEAIRVSLDGTDVGAVSYDLDSGMAAFEYTRDAIQRGIELSPIKMPLSEQIYSFPSLLGAPFYGLPGMIADSLPDDFGNSVLNAWVASQGRLPSEITPLQRLQFTGKRGMGALEYLPSTRLKGLNASQQVQIESLVSIAQEILDTRSEFIVHLDQRGQEDREAMLALLSVGMSAGGARPKAVLAFNSDFTQVRSGQTDIPAGFTHYLMKFDGVSEHHTNRETFGDPMGFGAMEYVYALMAKRCDIDMMPCRLLVEGTRRHFITQRFDRFGNTKRHVQTLAGMDHVNYKIPGSYSYAELFALARQLKLTTSDALQLFRRMVFNVVARNHDDHAKNFAFILTDQGRWQLAPAYDVAYSYKPGSKWVNSHWMTLNGKRDEFSRADFYAFEQVSSLFNRRTIDRIIDHTVTELSNWTTLARAHDVPASLVNEVAANLRLEL